MATFFEIPLAIKGLSRGLVVEQTPASYTGDCLNVRPRDVLESRIRIGQRPGFVRAYETQIGDLGTPVVAMVEVAVVI